MPAGASIHMYMYRDIRICRTDGLNRVHSVHVKLRVEDGCESKQYKSTGEIIQRN